MIKAYVNEMGIVLELGSTSDDLSDVEWKKLLDELKSQGKGPRQRLSQAGRCLSGAARVVEKLDREARERTQSEPTNKRT
jgi:hypothetical protein